MAEFLPSLWAETGQPEHLLPSYVSDCTLTVCVCVCAPCDLGGFLHFFLSFFSCKLCSIDLLQFNQNRGSAGQYLTWKQILPLMQFQYVFSREIYTRGFIYTKPVLLCSLPIAMVLDKCRRPSADLQSSQVQYL